MSPKVCAAGKHQEYVPQPEDIPVALRGDVHGQRLQDLLWLAPGLLAQAWNLRRGVTEKVAPELLGDTWPECAVWPELNWHHNLCETVTRANHENRQKRRRAARRQQTGDSTSSSNASSDEPEKADCGEAATDPRLSSQVKDNNSWTNATSFNRPCHLPVATIGASFSNWTMMAVEHQPPPASINSPSSCLKRSLCQICTLLQPPAPQTLSLSL